MDSVHVLLDIFKPNTDGLLCPRCERPLDGHDEANCKRKMSRRWFLGAATGIVVAAALPKVLAPAAKTFPAPTAWFTGAKHMLSMKDGYFVTSNLMGGRYKGWNLDKEVASLQASGFDVIVSDTEAKIRAEYWRRERENALVLGDERDRRVSSTPWNWHSYDPDYN